MPEYRRSSVDIAEVVSDLCAGRVGSPHKDADLFAKSLDLAQNRGPVVDATQIYRSLVDNPKPVYIYEDHPSIAPPWRSAFISYVNEHGNVVVMHLFSEKIEKRDRSEKWNAAGEVDWTKVTWINQITVWAGGRSNTTYENVPVMGPLHTWFHAVYEQGEPADIRWVHLTPEYPMENWDMANLVILGALNYMNCRNVEIVEPRRPRAESRRIARTGVRVSTINVFSVGRSSRSGEQSDGVPLTSVRGHFSCYGPDYNKGLLFGKLAGRFWIPQHARGEKTLGEIEHNYVLRPEG
jgi:hypothetical protein